MTWQQPVANLIATTFGIYDAPTPWAEARRRLHDAHNAYWLAAPTAGPPRYEVYQVTPAQVLGFPAGESFSPTRWTPQ